jgi:DNA invertase Pin-like site-specific DNA recombinase
MLIGCARVSKGDAQTTALQLRALAANGVTKTYEEHASGGRWDRPRQPGQRPKSDKLAPKVVQAVANGRSYRWIARDLGISKDTVVDIMKRQRHNSL